MNDAAVKEPDLAAIRAEMEKMAETPNAKRVTVLDQVGELYDVIRKMKTARYTDGDIAAFLSTKGLKVSAGTLRQYLNKIRATRGEGSDEASPKPAPKRVAKEAGKPVATPKATAAKSDDKPADKSGGKPLTTKPGMGGAFSSENL